MIIPLGKTTINISTLKNVRSQDELNEIDKSPNKLRQLFGSYEYKNHVTMLFGAQNLKTDLLIILSNSSLLHVTEIDELTIISGTLYQYECFIRLKGLVSASTTERQLANLFLGLLKVEFPESFNNIRSRPHGDGTNVLS